MARHGLSHGAMSSLSRRTDADVDERRLFSTPAAPFAGWRRPTRPAGELLLSSSLRSPAGNHTGDAAPESTRQFRGRPCTLEHRLVAAERRGHPIRSDPIRLDSSRSCVDAAATPPAVAPHSALLFRLCSCMRLS